MIELIFTKEAEWLKKWDAFLVENQKGSHLLLSDWLKSYNSYGFNFEVGILIEDNQIIGGYGAVIPKFLFFKFYIIPHGLVYKKEYENNFKEHVQQIIKHAKKIRTCYFQLSVPISSNNEVENHTYHPEKVKFLDALLTKGKLFSYVYCSYGLNWVDFKSYTTSEALLEQLTPKVRRNVRMGYNKNAKVTFVTDLELIKKGYKVIQENANQANYSVRDFKQISDTIYSLVNKKLAFFINCEVDNEVKASGFFIISGDYITNIMGGVLRIKPDIKLGYMMQWEIIKKSFELGFKGYNISMGGSEGVQDFKSKFGAETVYYENPHYHLVLNAKYFKLFRFFDIYLKPYKYKISSILSKIKS